MFVPGQGRGSIPLVPPIVPPHPEVAPETRGSCTCHLVDWPRIWTRNAVEPMRTSGTRRDSLDGGTSLTWTYETDRNVRDRDRLAHNPEVAGSNPVPATSGNDPSGGTSGVISMPLGNGFGNISIAN